MNYHVEKLEGWKAGHCRFCSTDFACHESRGTNGACPLYAAVLIPANGGKVAGDTQKARLATVLSDHRPHSTFELVRKVYGVNVATVARLASRVDDLRREGWSIRAMKSKKQLNKWWYCAMSNTAGVSSLVMANIVDHDIIVADAAAGEYE